MQTRLSVNHFRLSSSPLQPSPADVIDDIARRFGITREQAGELPLRTALRAKAPAHIQVIDAEFEVLAG